MYLITCFVVIRTKIYTSLVSTLSSPIYDKTAAKKRWSLSKIFCWKSKRRFAIYFLSSNFQCSPCADPRNLCANARIRLLTIHSFIVVFQSKHGSISWKAGWTSKLQKKVILFPLVLLFFNIYLVSSRCKMFDYKLKESDQFSSIIFA